MKNWRQSVQQQKQRVQRHRAPRAPFGHQKRCCEYGWREACGSRERMAWDDFSIHSQRLDQEMLCALGHRGLEFIA